MTPCAPPPPKCTPVSGKEWGGRETEGETKREGGTEKMCVYARVLAYIPKATLKNLLNIFLYTHSLTYLSPLSSHSALYIVYILQQTVPEIDIGGWGCHDVWENCQRVA